MALAPTQQLCRFFSQGRHCNFGKRCKFLHVRDDAKAHEKETAQSVGHRPSPADSTRVAPAAVRRPCRYFIAGNCTMEGRCRFWHPPEFPQLDDQPVLGNQRRAEPVSRPSILQEVKLSGMTEDIAKQLRDTEIRQLKKRFPGDQLIIQERSDGKVTYYRVTVKATDPDWVNTSSCSLRP